MRYTLSMRPEPEGGYTVTVPSLPGCITWGRDIKKAKAMAKDAIEAYLASLEKHGEAIPSDDEGLLATVDVDVKKAHG